MRWPLPSVCPRATGLIGTANRDGRFHLCNRDDTPRGYHPRTADRCPRTHSRQRLRGKATPARPRRLRGTYARSNDVDSVGASTPPKVSLGPISNIFSLSSYGPFDGVEEHLLANSSHVVDKLFKRTIQHVDTRVGKSTRIPTL